MRTALIVLAAAATAACDPRPRVVDGVPAATAPDTARGVLAVTGSAEASTLLLQPAGGAAPLALEGDAARALGALAGVEVMVAGGRTGARVPVAPAPAEVFRVERFVVRAVDGADASDGVLVESGGAWSLRLTTGGERRLGVVPAALQAYRGARVYVAGADGQRFGLIAR